MSVGPPAAPAGYLALAGQGGCASTASPRRRSSWQLAGSRGRPSTTASPSPASNCCRDGIPRAPPTSRRRADRRWRPRRDCPAWRMRSASFVERGDEFLAGPVGEAIVATVQQHGGVLDSGDLAAVRAEWTECAQVDVGARTVWATPAPTHGPTLLAAVADAQPGDDPATQYRRVLAAIDQRKRSDRRPVGHVDRQRRRPRRRLRRRRPLQLLPALRQRAGRRRLRPRSRQPCRPRLHARARTPQLPSRRPPSGNHAARLGGVRDDGRPRVPRRHAGRGEPGGVECPAAQAIIDGETGAGSLVTGPRWEWLPADDGVRIEAGFDETSRGGAGAVAPAL